LFAGLEALDAGGELELGAAAWGAGEPGGKGARSTGCSAVLCADGDGGGVAGLEGSSCPFGVSDFGVESFAAADGAPLSPRK
jgi:hypothetical protein